MPEFFSGNIVGRYAGLLGCSDFSPPTKCWLHINDRDLSCQGVPSALKKIEQLILKIYINNFQINYM